MTDREKLNGGDLPPGIGGFTGGPDETFIREFTQAQRALYLYILPLVGNASDADEVLQETNLVIWRKWDQFEPGSNFVAWGRAIARLEVFRFRRTNKSKLKFLDGNLMELIAERSDQQSDMVESKRRALAECMSRLRSKDRQLIQMRYSPDMTGDRVAEQLGRPANSVYQSLGRIRRVLAECVQRQLSEEGSVS